MKALFSQESGSTGRWTKACFLLIILGAWALILSLSPSNSGIMVDRAPFEALRGGGFVGVTPSILYTAFIWLFFTAGSAVGGFEVGILTFEIAQLLLCAVVCTYGVHWLKGKGVPLVLAFVFVLLFAAFVPFVQQALQPWISVPMVLCLFLLTLGLIDSVRDNCRVLRMTGRSWALYTLLAVLLLLDLSMLFVVIPTLVFMAFLPTGKSDRIALLSLCVLVLATLAAVFLFQQIAVSSQGLQRMPGVGGIELYRPEALSAEGLVLQSLPFVATLAVIAWVVLNRRPRHLLPFIPLVGLWLLILFDPFSRPVGFWFLEYAYLLCLPYLAFIPLITEFSDKKAEMRRRILARRSGIPKEDHTRRGEEACKVLLEKLRCIDPKKGFIGLYSAQGSELSLDYLSLHLATLGYRIAYPARITDTEMEFFTTLGVSNEALFDSLVFNKPFESVESTDIDLLTQIEPGQLSALVVPGIAYDANHYRLGFGGGYYDRYLGRVSEEVPKYGICYREQMVDAVPVENHDLPLDDVIIAQSAILSRPFQSKHIRESK